MTLYVCKEHVDKALDVVVDEEETFPELSQVYNSTGLSTTCEYCSEQALYMVANGGSSTK
ncbi:hypothetical protein N781_00360 [Pontibacillus halophilus JSM 076056 = DSM 19796]|uniref:CxxH/CxxC protein n=1 Tax=Pontibacillus halophilus JSM 076056 = DSM 19796 TaxID=1385510 RepID=A0A0A5GR27_9BACI|nr:CxxH/CxxC protein [Pontibacillus halophilus]KGX93703.1 hypothetical protein N781_00360 [Pontibacillus halophilus JSM 076056 = DSM 19796]